MPDNSLVTLIITAVTGAGFAAVITAIASWRKGVREQDVAEDQNALQGYKDLAAEYRTDLTRLKDEMAKEKEATNARFEKIEKEIAVERDLRWAAVQYARSLLVWITQHLPAEDPPPVPPNLADHIIFPGRNINHD